MCAIGFGTRICLSRSASLIICKFCKIYTRVVVAYVCNLFIRTLVKTKKKKRTCQGPSLPLPSLSLVVIVDADVSNVVVVNPLRIPASLFFQQSFLLLLALFGKKFGIVTIVPSAISVTCDWVKVFCDRRRVTLHSLCALGLC